MIGGSAHVLYTLFLTVFAQEMENIYLKSPSAREGANPRSQPQSAVP